MPSRPEIMILHFTVIVKRKEKRRALRDGLLHEPERGL